VHDSNLVGSSLHIPRNLFAVEGLRIAKFIFLPQCNGPTMCHDAVSARGLCPSEVAWP